jgi:hypothetical protein
MGLKDQYRIDDFRRVSYTALKIYPAILPLKIYIFYLFNFHTSIFDIPLKLAMFFYYLWLN